MVTKFVIAPCFGTVAYMHCDPGSRVQEGEPVMEIEAMKMTNPAIAPMAGFFHPLVELGVTVNEGQAIGRITT